MSTRARLNAALDRMEFADRDDVIFFGAGVLPGDTPGTAAKQRAQSEAEAKAAAKAKAKAKAEAEARKRKRGEKGGGNDEPTELDPDLGVVGISNRTIDLVEQLENAKERNAPPYRIKLLEKELQKSIEKDDKAEDVLKRRNLYKRLNDYTNWTSWGTLNVPKPGTVYVRTPTLPPGYGFV